MVLTRSSIEKEGKLTWSQIQYFIFLWTWYGFLDNKKFPFRDQVECEALWKDNEKNILDMIYWEANEFPNLYRVPNSNWLRPRFWFLYQPEKRKLFNGTDTLGWESDKKWRVYSVDETDLEFLSRLALMETRDIQRSQSESFIKEEEGRLNFRRYLIEEAQRRGPIPHVSAEEIPPSSVEVEGQVHPEAPLPEEVTDPCEPEAAVLPKNIVRLNASGELIGAGAKCPKCWRSMELYDEERLICKRCGVLYDRATLPDLYMRLDAAKKFKSKILGDYD